MLKVVSNSSPLIHLTKIGKLNLLKKFFKMVLIPEAVYIECIVEGKNREDANLIKNADWIKVEKIKDDNLVRLLYSELDRGESEAIVLALEYKILKEANEI